MNTSEISGGYDLYSYKKYRVYVSEHGNPKPIIEKFKTIGEAMQMVPDTRNFLGSVSVQGWRNKRWHLLYHDFSREQQQPSEAEAIIKEALK